MREARKDAAEVRKGLRKYRRWLELGGKPGAWIMDKSRICGGERRETRIR